MGFLPDDQPVKRETRAQQKAPTLETLHRMQCHACPLGPEGTNRIFYNSLRHPQMPPYGKGEHPRVYMLGEAPGKDEDARGRPFVGRAGNALHLRIPDWADDDTYLRWNNVVRCRPPGNRTPEFVEVECCRPSVQGDIERHQPFAIFGFGNVPLHWAIGERGILNWTGRHLPVRIGSHECWYFPIVHPSAIIRGRRFEPSSADSYGSDAEFGFALDVRRAFETVEDYFEDDYRAQVHSKEEALAGLELVDGSGSDDLQRVLGMLQHCAESKLIGFDYETQNKRPYSPGSKLLTVGLSTKQRTMSFALQHPGHKWGKQLDKVEDALEQFLLTAQCCKAVHNLAFEQEWTAWTYGTDSLRSGQWADTMLQAYVLDERQGALSLEFLCMQYFGLNIKALAPPMDKKNMQAEPLEKVLPYQGVDARYHRALYLQQHQRLLEDGSMEFYEHMLRRVPAAVLTQIKGIPVHQPTVRATYDEWLAKRTAVEEKIAALDVVKRFAKTYRTDFRPSATKELKVLLKMLGVTTASVDEEALQQIRHTAATKQLVGLILEWREAHKILSTYVLPVLDDPEVEGAGSALHPDKRMHPVTTLHKTRTSRTASEETNYQNWPKREHKEIRCMVKVRKHWKLCSFDYGQIQARNVAMESLDKALIKAFWDRYDIHHDWTERISSVYPRWMAPKGGVEKVKASKGSKTEDHWKYYRDIAKNKFVFPSFFGAGGPTLSGYLSIPEDVVSRLHRQFWQMFPSIKAWQERLKENFYRDGYTTSLAGHRRHAPAGHNEIINAPIQADEAKIVLDAMARLSELGRWEYQANMEIHDDLTFIWPANEVEEHAKVVVQHMIMVPFKWAHVVPIVVEFSIGDDWGIKREVGNYASDTWKGSLGIDDAKRRELGIA